MIRQDGVNVQNTDYYPYGESMTHSSGDAAQPYKFGGKEYDAMHGLNLYDFSARMKSDWGFTTVDPLAEKKPWLSPYIYCSDNPVSRIDPDGKDDYYNEINGKYLGTDGTPGSGMRLISQETFSDIKIMVRLEHGLE